MQNTTSPLGPLSKSYSSDGSLRGIVDAEGNQLIFQPITGYTAAQLSAMALAGELTAGATYVASDTGLRSWAETASNLVPATLRIGATGYASVFRTEALVKLSSPTPSFNVSAGLSAGDFCLTYKQEMEAGFNAVRLVRMNTTTSAQNSSKAVIGVTETNATDTNANLAFPKLGGVAYQALAGATNDQGFRAVTWAGASSVSTGASTTVPVFSLSDWTPIKDTPRASGESSTRPLLMWRFEHLGSTNGNWAFIPCGTGMRTANTANRGRTFVASKYTSSGAITDLSNARAFSLDATSNQLVWPIVRFNTPVFSVWGVGDSITTASTIVTDVQTSWGYRACCDVSTPTTPVVWANWGVASVASVDFWASVKAALAAGLPPPSMLVLNAGSVNEFGSTPDVRKVETCVTLVHDAIATCRQYSIPFLAIWGTLPNANIATAPYDDVRKSSNAQLEAAAGALKIIWLDMLTGLGDGASPERWVSGTNFDNFHPNETSMDTIMAPRLAAAIRVAMVS